MKKANTKVSKKMSGGKIAAVGAGLAVATAGAYYFLGPKGKAHQKKAVDLYAKMKKEVASEVKKAKVASAPLYNKAVDIVSKNYAAQYKLHEKDIKDFAKKIKGEWKGVNTAVKKTVKTLKAKAK